MGTWFWLNIPLALLFVCCWAGIPLWLTLKRWNVELEAKNAELAAGTAAGAVVAQPASAAEPRRRRAARPTREQARRPNPWDDVNLAL